jgi:hypothetical protein
MYRYAHANRVAGNPDRNRSIRIRGDHAAVLILRNDDAGMARRALVTP